MAAYDFKLIIKHILEYGVAWAPQQEIIYRDQTSLSYKEMYDRVLRLSGALQALGVQKGTKIGVIEWDSHRFLEMYFAIPGIGAVLHTINPRLAPDDLVYTMAHTEDEILIFHEDFQAIVEAARPRLPSIKKYILISDKDEKPEIEGVFAEYEEFIASASPLEELPDLEENTMATMAYTTGTTGKPKGVYFTHRQVCLHTLCASIMFSAFGNYGGVNKHSVYMPLTPMFHAHAWGIPYLATLFGIKQIYPGKYEPDLIVHLVQKEKVTFSHCVPTILQMIITSPAVQGADLTGWSVLIGGSQLPKGLALEASKFGIQLYVGYGLSETCPILTVSNLKPFIEEAWSEEKQLDIALKTGFPMPLTKLRLITPKGEDVARDGIETGEIVVRSPWLTQGYYKDPARSEELWAGDWMHTGDIANIDEHGYIMIVDRLKDVIKSGGEWIVSLELENLLSIHEDVLASAVIGVSDEKWGERPLAIVVPNKGAADRITADMMRTHMKKFVSDGVIANWQVPDNFVFMEELPKTSVGKIDKKMLRSNFDTLPEG